MRNVRIKVCGLTEPQQAKQIALLGVDAIGLIVGAKSKRQISLSKAKAIIKEIPPFVSKVVLSVNQSAEQVQEMIRQLEFDYIQFHGDESSEFCNQFNFPYIRCLHVKADTKDLPAKMQTILDEGAQAVLLDAWDDKQYGGTGKQIRLRNSIKLPHPFILAGGINADNATQKVLNFQPYAIDVNSGVENAPGDKNIEKIQLLMQNLRSCS
jgi:phosphoribosylanthranilate isomerase